MDNTASYFNISGKKNTERFRKELLAAAGVTLLVLSVLQSATVIAPTPIGSHTRAFLF